MLKEYIAILAEVSISPSWDVQQEVTAAELDITKSIMTALPAKLALFQDH
jgi:hypothetical protein